MFSDSNTWNTSEYTYDYLTTGGTWSYSKISTSKDYIIVQESYEGKFGTKPVIQAKGEGEKRFYVMALSDITSSNTTDNKFT